MTWRRLVLLDGALLGLAIVASRLALVLHEAVGHGLTAWMLGAAKISFRLSYFGGGYVTPAGLRTTGAGTVLFTLGGIAVNLLTGAAAWFFARRLRHRPLLHAFLLMLGAGSVGQALWYLAIGFYYGEGDPRGFVSRPENLADVRWMWILFVVPFAAAAGLAAREWLEFLGRHTTLDTPGRRIGWTAATVGVATAAYAGLWLLTWDAKVDVTLRQLKVETEIAREKARRPPPTPTPATPTPPPAPVTEEDVADKVPGPWAGITLLAAGLLASGAVLWRARPAPAEPASLSPLAAAIPVTCAAAVLGAIALIGR